MTRREWLAISAAPLIPRQGEFLLVDAVTGKIVESTFPERAQPCGSLVKPFTALAYTGQFPTLVCKGAASGCWSVAGHGRVGLVQALSHSCNFYFQNIAQAVTSERLTMVASEYRIEPPQDQAVETRIGLGRNWTITPLRLVHAYLELARRKHPLITEGLRECALRGTAHACGPGVLAKTGTSVCAHSKPSPGDGWAIAVFPDVAPRYAILVRQDGVPGVKAAETLASRMHSLWRPPRS